MAKTGELFEKLQEVVHKLRDPVSGCPWDKEQTHESLKRFLIEECYEALDAIDRGTGPGSEKFPDELGDVLLQIMLHSEIASETGRFDVSTVVSSITQKMITRHPHVFGDVKASTTKEVLSNWENSKKKELKTGESILDGVPRGMPALLRAERTGEKVARVVFEWPTLEGVRDKVFEKLRAFIEVCTAKDKKQERVKDEFGDLLFSLSQLARRMDLHGEELLHSATDKFTRRFKEVERRAGPDLKSAGLEKLDALWNEVKREEKKA